MRSLTASTVIVLLVSAVCSASEQGRLSGPVSAFVLDEGTRSVRAVLGVPGAAYLGDSILADVDLARVSPDGMALGAVRSGALSISRAKGDTWDSAALAAELPGSTAMAWSADSETLALLDASATVRVWDASGNLRATRSLPGRVTALAVRGADVIAAIPGAGVFLSDDRGARLLAQADEASALALAGEDLYFADRSRGDVWLMRGFAGAGELALAAKLEDPVALAVDSKRRLLLAVSAAARKLVGFRLGSFEPVFELALEFEPSILDKFGESAWLLNAGRRGPLQILSYEDGPAVYFIPREESK